MRPEWFRETEIKYLYKFIFLAISFSLLPIAYGILFGNMIIMGFGMVMCTITGYFIYKLINKIIEDLWGNSK